MFEQTVETSATPHITVTECTGNLVVQGSEERRITIRVQGGAKDTGMERKGETFTLAARANCRLACPPATTLTVGTAGGRLKVEGVEGPVAIGNAYGNVDLRDVGSAALEQVFGNLSAHQVAGSLEVERVQGNVRLGPPFSPGATYRLNASGNLTVRLPADASLRLALRAGGGVRSRVPGLALEEVEGKTQGVLGAGEARLEAQVGGRVSLWPLEAEGVPPEALEFNFVADLEGLGAQIEAHVAKTMAEVEARLAESLGRIDSEEVRRRAERATERATERARREAERAAEQVRRAAEREAERARLRAEQAERRWRRASGRRPRPKREPATDAERMRVLRLVEEGKITPEQAADLLAALEGR